MLANQSLGAGSNGVPTDTCIVKQLLILGNGFDLECDLRSTFSDFLKDRKKYFDNIVKDFMQDDNNRDLIVSITRIHMFSREMDDSRQSREWINMLWAVENSKRLNKKRLWNKLKEQVQVLVDSDRWLFMKCVVEACKNKEGYSLTAWDILLRNKDGYWTDVERAIFELLAIYQKDGTGEKLNKVMELHKASLSGLGDVNAKEKRMLRDYLRYNSPGVIDFGGVALNDVMYSQLKNLEEDFKTYMKEELQRVTSYDESAENLLEKLLNDQISCYSPQKVCSDILSFNYTQPQSTSMISGKYINIHGQLDAQIIFGIDGMRIYEDNYDSVI